MEHRDADGALRGLRVVAFESRRAVETARLLERHGAEVISAPALREVAIEDNPAAFEGLDRLRRGEIDVFVLLTGVGFRLLVEAWTTRCTPAEAAALLRRTALVARGPKPVQALRSIGLEPTLVVGEPNTWRELLAALDRELPVLGRRVAVQEYGRSNAELLGGLAERGAAVFRVPVYRWALPEDAGPLRDAAGRLARGEAEVAAFTTAVQVDHLLAVADGLPGGRAAVLEALRERVVVAGIGPSVREALEALRVPLDVLPEHPKLGWFASAIAAEAPAALARKRDRAAT
ncbi:MAG: hypothetical protein RL698_2401 [Pseudomonadota bacterium]|jgi:uroporphyrinogen-III synthase